MTDRAPTERLQSTVSAMREYSVWGPWAHFTATYGLTPPPRVVIEEKELLWLLSFLPPHVIEANLQK